MCLILQQSEEGFALADDMNSTLNIYKNRR